MARVPTPPTVHHTDNIGWNPLPNPKETVTGDEIADIDSPIEVTMETYPAIESDTWSDGQRAKPVPKDSCELC
jgi:hypothetical protein